MDNTLLETALTRKAVIFDFDGVLAKIHVDWPALKRELQNLIASELGTCDELTPFDLQLNRILKKDKVSLTKKVNQLIENYELKEPDQHQVFPDVLKTVQQLATHEIPLFICSSNTRKVIEHILEKTETSTCFRQIISREDIQQRKPDPEGLLKIMKDHQLHADHTLFIGDRDIDHRAGLAAGIETLLISPTNSVYLE